MFSLSNPKKLLVQYSGSLSIKTKSEEDSLKFYLDTGENTGFILL